MLFSSIPFLFYFLPAVILLYYAVPKGFKNTVLFLSSLFFYGWGEPRYLIFLLFSITSAYFFGILIERYRGERRSGIFLTVSVFISLGLLGYCKYTDFFIENIHLITGLSVPILQISLPIGISFYTFQIISYVVDIYRQDVTAQKNYCTLGAYVAMFPQLIAGPIVRYSDIAVQLENRTHSLPHAAAGIRRFVLGLSKKILLANLLGEFVAIYKDSQTKSVLFVWLYAVAYTLHIYFDFSGYSDMAIGLGKIFGFQIPENFQYPYISCSITEFWRRWHISLGTWFRDYVYIPLGGSRVSKPRWLFNILVVWLATGFWHGAAWNFILWGLLFACLLILEKVWLLPGLKKVRGWNHLYVLFFVVIGFILFDAADVTSAGYTLQAMFGAGHLPAVTAETLYYFKSYCIIFFIAMLGATPFPAQIIQKFTKNPYIAASMTMLEPIAIVGLLIVCTAFLVDGSFNPFLYFRF